MTRRQRDCARSAHRSLARKTFDADVDFKCDDALAKLERLGRLKRDGDRLSVLPLDEALIRLDRIWDSFFPFDSERKATSG